VEETPLASSRPDRRSWRTRRLVGAIVILGIAGLGASMVAHGKLDPDESQHLHVAWLIEQGRVMYADFWEHHMPLLPFALAPVTRWFADQPDIYFAARAIMAVTAAATLCLVYVLGGHVGPGVGVAAVVLLAVQVRFFQHVIQVRPDAPALLTWLVTVLTLVRWRERDREQWLWIAGLALGLTATFTPKAAFLGLGVAAVILASPSPSLSRTLRRLACVATGCAVPLAAFFVWLAAAGGRRALSAFVEDVVVANLRFPDFIKQTAVGGEGAGFVALALIGVAMTVHRLGLRVLRDPVHGPLLIPTVLVSLVLLLPSTPAVYSYTWLPVLAAGSLYAGSALVAAVERVRAGAGMRSIMILMLAVVGGLVLPLVVFGALTFPPNRGNAVELERMRRELAYACPGEAVLDARALAVFRATALRYPSLVRGVRTWIKQGVIPSRALIEDLWRARAPVGVLDSRLRDDGPISAFIEKYYVLEPDGLLVVGASVAVPEGAGDADVELLVPGRYEMTMPPGGRATIDGAVLEPGAWLREGRHRVSWNGERGVIRLTIAPCAKRRP
jgi:dolichyl-phosphate-mannose-protein mannosyltransferase